MLPRSCWNRMQSNSGIPWIPPDPLIRSALDFWNLAGPRQHDCVIITVYCRNETI